MTQYSWVWHIDSLTNKDLYDFYKVLTFKWYASKSLDYYFRNYSYLSEATVENF